VLQVEPNDTIANTFKALRAAMLVLQSRPADGWHRAGMVKLPRKADGNGGCGIPMVLDCARVGEIAGGGGLTPAAVMCVQVEEAGMLRWASRLLLEQQEHEEAALHAGKCLPFADFTGCRSYCRPVDSGQAQSCTDQEGIQQTHDAVFIEPPSTLGVGTNQDVVRSAADGLPKLPIRLQS